MSRIGRVQRQPCLGCGSALVFIGMSMGRIQRLVRALSASSLSCSARLLCLPCPAWHHGLAPCSLLLAPCSLLLHPPLDWAPLCLIDLCRCSLSSAALVCKRLHQLSCSPELLRAMTVSCSGEGTLAKARSLLAWLTQHGKHVRSLDLNLTVTDDIKGNPIAEAELGALATCCLAAFSGPASQLQRLEVGEGVRLPTTAWLPAMQQLEYANIGSVDNRLELVGSLRASAALQELRLYGHPVQLAAAHLPTALTRLELCDVGTSEMPQQIALLTSLRSLSLGSCAYSSNSMSSLSQLAPNLTRMELISCHNLPPQLSALTALRSLVLMKTPKSGLASRAALDTAIEQLRQLTALAILKSRVSVIPPSIARLSCLQFLAFTVQLEGGPPQQLPAGAWVHSLRTLHTHSSIAAQSIALFKEAQQLSTLCLADLPAERADVAVGEWEALWDWAAAHKPLTCFTFDLGPGYTSPIPHHVFDNIMRLHSVRPHLVTFRHCSATNPDSILDQL